MSNFVKLWRTKKLVIFGNLWYNFLRTNEERGSMIMCNFTKIYGETTIQKELEEDLKIIKLKYYKTKDNRFSKNVKQYGVGVIKTEATNHELNEEKQEFNHICGRKEEVENLLKILLQNKVTPIDLKYVLEDLVLQ